MSILLKKVKCFTFSNDPNLGALSVSQDGSQFSVQLDNPIYIPKAAISCSIDVIGSNIWYVQPNVSDALGNNIFAYIYNGDNYSFTIQDGLYSLEALNALLSKEFLRNGFDANLIVLTGDDATQRCILTFTATNLQVDFTSPNSVRTVLGFNAGIVPATIQPINYFVFGDVEAKFNNINNFYITSSLCGDGLPINNVSTGIIASIPIPNGSAGRLISYQPNIPVRIDVPELIGRPISNFTFQLLDDNLKPAPTLGEKYSFILHIHYQVLITSLEVPLLQGF